MQRIEQLAIYQAYIYSLIQGGSNEKILVGPALSNDDVIRAMTSLLPPSIQNIGGAAAPVAPPVATPLHKMYCIICK